MRLFILLILLMIIFASCNKDCSPTGADIPTNFIFLERIITTTGEIIETDTTKFITIRTVEPSMFYSFDQENRILEYTSGERDRVPLNDDLLVWIASKQFWYPPDQMGLRVSMNPIYYNSRTYLDSNFLFHSVNNEGTVELGDNRLSTGFSLPVDSLIIQTFYRYKKVPLSGEDPFAPIDSALIKLTDEVRIYNRGYLNENQIIWKDL